jgi:hypothetical protein
VGCVKALVWMLIMIACMAFLGRGGWVRHVSLD